jgi:transcriptional regulator GlxA family with amidase domain
MRVSDTPPHINGFNHIGGSQKRRRHRVGFLAFDGVRAIDLTGPLEAFATSRKLGEGQDFDPGYDCMIVGLKKKSFVCQSGVAFGADETTKNVGPLDTVIVPGGRGLKRSKTSLALSAWLIAHADRAKRIAAICDGIYPLAQTGLLDGRTVTTHWRCASEVARRFRALKVKSNASFLKDGSFYTCGSGTAAIELAISLVREDHGSEFALALARELVVRLRSPGEKEAQLDVSACQLSLADKIAELPAWIAAHLDNDFSQRILVERAGVSRRHLRRLFKAAYNRTPAELVEQLRLREAGRRLHTTRNKIDSIASAVGYASPDVFRRAFERWVGLSPREYRKAFSSGASTRITAE